jgi:hypothetical protein
MFWFFNLVSEIITCIVLRQIYLKNVFMMTTACCNITLSITLLVLVIKRERKQSERIEDMSIKFNEIMN